MSDIGNRQNNLFECVRFVSTHKDTQRVRLGEPSQTKVFVHQFSSLSTHNLARSHFSYILQVLGENENLSSTFHAGFLISHSLCEQLKNFGLESFLTLSKKEKKMSEINGLRIPRWPPRMNIKKTAAIHIF
jgi:hypothetical protein